VNFFRFPHTPHLAWLGSGEPRDDKVLSTAEVEGLLAHEVVVEEKVDGANLGFSTTEDGELRAQNRGSYLEPDRCHDQFRPLWSWLGPRREALVEALWPDLMLFGEWCAAVHSVTYDRLPDWFLGFDVYDRLAETFWDTRRRNDLLTGIGLQAVPTIAVGIYSLGGLEALLGPSRLGGEPMEGLVARRESEGRTIARGKLVRAEFTQAIGEHWSRGPMRRNRLAEGVQAWL
jgi:ATP-dependent RNA circularization protein (DNA/RNA ligase family)